MSKVPEGWKETPLKNLAHVLVSPVDKKSYPDELPVRLCNYMDVYSNHRINADMDFMTATATAAQIAKFLVAEHDVLITKDSETPRDIAIPALMVGNFDDVVCGYHLAILRPKPSTLSGEFLHHSLQADFVRDYFFRIATGSTRFGLSVGGIENAPILLPPLPEQKKIAAILSSVDDAIAATQAVIDQTRKVKDGLLQDLLTRGIGHTRFKQTEIGEIPEGWEVKTIAELGVSPKTVVKAGPFGSALTKDVYVPEGYKVYGQEQVLRGDIAYGDYYIAQEKYDELQSCSVECGDLLMSLVGTVGKVLIIPDDFERGVINPRLLRLRLDQSKMLPQFLRCCFMSRGMQGELEAKSQGGTMGVLNAGIVKALKVPVPPLEDQGDIVSLVSSVENTLQDNEATIQQLTVLKRGLMQDLLSGSVRVTTP